MKSLTTIASALAVLSFSSTPFAAESPDCNKVCQNAVAVFSTPTSYDAKIGTNKDGGSIVYATWTSKSDLALAPVKFAGTVDARLHSTELTGVSMPDPKNGCEVVISLVEHGSKGSKTYQVPARNVLCEPAPE